MMKSSLCRHLHTTLCVLLLCTLSACNPVPPSGSKPHAATTTDGFPITLKDDAGRTVTISHKPTAIVSTTEGTDEILTVLVPLSSIKMVTPYAKDPQYSDVVSLVKNIPVIDPSNAEAILAVHPDLVLLASYTTDTVTNQIEAAGVPAYEMTSFTSIKDIESHILTVGQLVGAASRAKQIVDGMKQHLAEVHNSVANEPEPTVLDYSSYGYAAGSNTTVDNIITAAGGKNVASQLNGWQKVSIEDVVRMNPDIIIDSEDDAPYITKLMKDPRLQDVRAIEDHRVYLVSGADLSSVSQNVIRGVDDLVRILHPNAPVPK